MDFDNWLIVPPGTAPFDALVDFQRVGNTVDPLLYGKVTVVNAQGFCGRVRMQSLDVQGNVLNTYNSPMACPNGAGPLYVFVLDAPFAASANIDSVKVSAMLRLNGQTWQEQQSSTLYA